jgi:hypothetical protein
MRRRRSAILAVLAALAACIALPAGASARALVLRLGPEDGCEVGPTDIPGVAVDIPATCFVVAAPGGHATVHVRGAIPAGFSLAGTYVAEMPCFFPGLGEGSGRIVATRGGQISATCQI